MRLPRFSIAGMVGIVAAIAIGLTALRYASHAWAVGLMILTLTLLFTSILGSVHGTNRDFWRGVALFGWGFLLLDCFNVTWIDSTLRPLTYLNGFYTELYPFLYHNPPRVDPSFKGASNAAAGMPAPLQLFSQEHRSFQSVGIWLSRLLFALLGGIVGRIVIPRDRPRSEFTTYSISS